MPATVPSSPSTIMPAMRYRDANAAIEWLCNVFGFERLGPLGDQAANFGFVLLCCVRHGFFSYGFVIHGRETPFYWAAWFIQMTSHRWPSGSWKLC